jgi:hypothetical protein
MIGSFVLNIFQERKVLNLKKTKEDQHKGIGNRDCSGGCPGVDGLLT